MTRDEILSAISKGASLAGANLTGANLTGANLTRANLTGANLAGANLAGANLAGASLSGASLSGANLSWAGLTRANLSWANLAGANLTRAYLSWANLSWANLAGANLAGANLTEAKLPYFQIPQEGGLVVWKKLEGGVIAKLLVPGSARRTATPIGRKCRAEFVQVLELFNCYESYAFDSHTGSVRYFVGGIVKPDSYDDDIRIECTHGIHFFLTREEAEAY